MSSLPQLPNEIICRILEHVSPADILDLRIICRMFRTHIETRIFYKYLQSAEIICCYHVFLKKHNRHHPYSSKTLYSRFRLATTFDDKPNLKPNDTTLTSQDGPAWKRRTAIFNLVMPWQNAGFKEVFKGALGADDEQYWWDSLAHCVSRERRNLPVIKWVFKMGDMVIDVGKYDLDDMGLEIIRRFIDNDVEKPVFERPPRADGSIQQRGVSPRCSQIIVAIPDWIAFVWNCLREERALGRMMRSAEGKRVTYSIWEDSVRQMRRDVFEQRGTQLPHEWFLKALWGGRDDERRGRLDAGRGVVRSEDEAVEVLGKLRNE